jgi:hypothetical protein
MSIGQVEYLRRISHIAYSRHPVARLHRAWLNFFDDGHAIDILLLPLTGLALSLLVLAAFPDAGDTIAAACSMACMP